MKNCIFFSILFSVFCFARAETAQFVSYTCDFQRAAVDGMPWFGSGMTFRYPLVPQFNQVHVSEMTVTGHDDNLFAGHCAGLASEGAQPHLMIRWAEGNGLEGNLAFGCGFSGSSVKLTDIRQKWAGGDEYLTARKTFVDGSNRPIEIVVVVGMKPIADMNKPRCADLYKKIIGDGRMYQDVEKSPFHTQRLQ